MKHENVAEKSRFQAFPHRRHKTRRRLFVPKIVNEANERNERSERTEAEDFPALKSYDNYAAVGTKSNIAITRQKPDTQWRSNIYAF